MNNLTDYEHLLFRAYRMREELDKQISYLQLKIEGLKHEEHDTPNKVEYEAKNEIIPTKY